MTSYTLGVTPEALHEAMQNAPHDGKPYRQGRAALAMVEAAVALHFQEVERLRGERDRALTSPLDAVREGVARWAAEARADSFERLAREVTEQLGEAMTLLYELAPADPRVVKLRKRLDGASLTTEPPATCQPWCGKNKGPGTLYDQHVHVRDDRIFCTGFCADAGKPQRPAARWGEPTPGPEGTP